MKCLLPSTVLVFVAGIAAGAEFHLSLNGGDDLDGSAQAPWKSLAAAKEKIRAWRMDHPSENVIVTLHQGTYRLQRPLVFQSDDAGTAKVSVTYRAAPGENVVISGGRQIVDWTESERGLWVASVAESHNFRELFHNEIRLPRASHPDSGFLRAAAIGPDKRTSLYYGPGTIPPAIAGDDVELVFLHDWSTSRIRVQEFDGSNLKITTAFRVGHNAPHYAMDHYEKNPRYRLENSLTLLDSPGEWYLDRAAHKVTLKGLPGETLAQLNQQPPVAPLLKKLIEIRGDAGHKVQNLEFLGIAFEHCAWDLPKNGYAAGQSCTFEVREEDGKTRGREFVPAAISAEHAETIRFANCRFSKLGGSGIWLGAGCNDCAIQDCLFTNIAGNGVMIGEDGSRRVHGKNWWESAPEQAAQRNRIERCVIEHCGEVFLEAVGVWVGLARETTILQNTIQDLPYTGISLGWMWNPTPTSTGGHLVERNHIARVMQVLSDGAGIYSLGLQPKTQLTGNVIHEVPLNAGRAESNGMFLDEGSTAIQITGNLIYSIAKSPLRFHKAGENFTANNLLVTPDKMPTMRFNNTLPENIKVDNNIEIITPTGSLEGLGIVHIRKVRNIMNNAGRPSE